MSSCSLVHLPEEGEQLLSAARGPGQIHAVVASIRGHDEARSAAGVLESIVVNSKTGQKEWERKIIIQWCRSPEIHDTFQHCEQAALLQPYL